MLSGNVWHDADHDDTLDTGLELPLEGWTVDLLLRDDQPIRSMLTDARRQLRCSPRVPPNYAERRNSIHCVFSAPGAGIRTALLGQARIRTSPTDLQRIDEIVVHVRQ